MRRNRRLNPDRSPSKSEMHDLLSMQRSQTLAVEAARAIVADLGGNSDLIALPIDLYADLKTASPWHESEN